MRAVVLAMMIAGFVAVCVRPAEACLWDRSTRTYEDWWRVNTTFVRPATGENLAAERAAFPGVLELITGKFARHSPDYFRWRVRDCTAKIAANPPMADLLPLLDDLAVAHEKLGDHDAAIAVARKQLALDENRYETHANLGTFLIHAGQFDEGLKHIDRALDINPDAHFGRERIQKYLVEFILDIRAKADPDLLLLREVMFGFSRFVAERESARQGRAIEPREVAEDVYEGVVGMMRFGRHDSPILLAALVGAMSALSADRLPQANRNWSRQLATRAILSATAAATDVSDVNWLRAMAESEGDPAPSTIMASWRIAQIEAAFAIECADADAWVAQMRADERAWIAAGLDVDAEFARDYSAPPRVADLTFWQQMWLSATPANVGAIVYLIAFAIVMFRSWRWMRLARKSKARAKAIRDRLLARCAALQANPAAAATPTYQPAPGA